MYSDLAQQARTFTHNARNDEVFDRDIYFWNSNDDVKEYFSLYTKNARLFLSDLDVNIPENNLFGCYISLSVRKRRNNFFSPKYSSLDTFSHMFICLHRKLSKYKKVKKCPSVTPILVYEGGRSSSDLQTNTEYVLEKYALKEENEYWEGSCPETNLGWESIICE